MSFPLSRENVQSGRCSDCNIFALLHWHFGSAQERKLCTVCGEEAWRKMLFEAGRRLDWEVYR